jgi:hypothetical protein
MSMQGLSVIPCLRLSSVYLQYPERPMVKLIPNQVVKTEWDGKWWITKVKEASTKTKQIFTSTKRFQILYIS